MTKLEFAYHLLQIKELVTVPLNFNKIEDFERFQNDYQEINIDDFISTLESIVLK